MTAAAPLRVVLVDDQALVRSGFALILSIEDDIEIVGQADNGERAVELVRRTRPDVVLMDVQMPGLDGIDATRQIVADGLSRVVILTTFDRDDYLFDGLSAGASGFLLKNADPDDLVSAVRAVGHGHALLAPEVTRRVIEAMTEAAAGAAAGRGATREQRRALVTLTEREREVLELVAAGLSNAEIATRLHLGEATVKTHVSNVLAKLGVRDRVQAVVFAYQAGLTPGAEWRDPPSG